MAAKKKTAYDRTKTVRRRMMRKNAEKELHESPAIPFELTGKDKDQIIHELRVHQIELEMQAEELRRSHFELEESRDKFLDQYDFAPIGLLTLNDKGTIVEANLSSSIILGFERSKLVRARFPKFVALEDQDHWHRFILNVFHQSEKQHCTLLLKRADGSAFPARVEAHRLGSEGNYHEIRIAFLDITDIKLAQEKLIESQTRFNELAEQSNTVVWEIDANGLITYVSHVSEDVWGYRPDELIGHLHICDLKPEPERETSKAECLAIFKRKEPFLNLENKIQKRDGSEVWISTNGIPILNADRTLRGYQGSDTDITQRKVAEEALRKTTAYLENLLDYANAPIITWDPELRITRFNHAFEDLTLLPEQDVIGQRLDILFPKESRDTSLLQIKKTLEGERWETIEIPILTKDGSVRTVLWNSANITNPEGRIISTIAQGVDITQRKVAEEELQKAHNTLETQVKQRTADLYAANMQLQKEIENRKVIAESLKEYAKMTSILSEVIITANKADSIQELFRDTLDKALELLDFEGGGIYLVNPSERTAEIRYTKNLPEDLVRQRRILPIHAPPYDTLFIKNLPIITDHYEKMSPDLAQKYHLYSMASIPLVSKNIVIGALNVASSKRYTISADEQQVLITIGRELGTIVERLRAEEGFKKASENLQVLFDSVNEMIFVLDIQGRILKVNKTVESKLGYTNEELHDTDVLLLHVPERRDEASINVQGMIAGTIDSCPVPLLSKNKKIIEVETKVTRGGWDGNEVLIGVSRDVTERKQAEQAQLQSEKKYSRIIENSRDIIYTLTQEGVFTFVSPSWTRLLGHPVDQVVGKPFQQFVHPEDLPRCMAFLQLVLTTSDDPGEVEYRVKHLNGGWYWHSSSALPAEYDAGRFVSFYGIARDITGRKQAEEKLHELSDRLSLAVQAGGVGIWDYDVVNNTLTWDDQMFALYGITRQQFSGAYEAWQAGLHPDDRKRGDANIQQAIRGEKEFDTEFRVLWPDGTIRNIRALALVHRDAAGKPLRMIGTNWDITDQKNAETALQENDILLRLILSLSARFINISSDKINYEISTAIGELGRFAGVDRSYVFLLSDDGMSMHNTHEWCAEGIVPQKDALQDLSTGLFPWWMERLHRFETIHVPRVEELPEEAGNEKEILQMQDIKSVLIVPLISQNTLIGFLGFDSVRHEKTWPENIITLVTITGKSISNAIERERAEEALRKSEFFLKETQKVARLGGWKANPNTNFLEWTDEVYDIIEAPHDYRPGLIEGMKYYDPEDIPLLREKMSACLLTGEPFGIEVRLITETGKKVSAEVRGLAPVIEGARTYVIGTLQDITERKRQAEEIAASLLEKETLLKEIHHRVKNNMQVISSLLLLQRKQISDPETRALFQESENRIFSIALVHEKLYRSKSLSNVDVQDYLRMMGDYLFTSFDIAPGRLALEIKAEGIFLPIDKAIPLSLITNELLTNSLKHAFPDQRKGSIRISMTREKGHYRYIFHDDGIGFPAHIDFHNTESLGMQLVNGLVGQILGKITLTREKGTTFEIVFTIVNDTEDHHEQGNHTYC